VARYWVVRTDVDVAKNVIVPSLDAGDLCQGCTPTTRTSTSSDRSFTSAIAVL
jgi:hypothetical protein